MTGSREMNKEEFYICGLATGLVQSSCPPSQHLGRGGVDLKCRSVLGPTKCYSVVSYCSLN